MEWIFNPPPGWPPAPAGYVPPPGFRPDPSWPVAPVDWQYWIPARPHAAQTHAAQTHAAQTHALAQAYAPERVATSAPMSGFDPTAPVCRFCQGRPAIRATARAHRGMIIVMTFRKIEGPFCRSCGQAMTRKLSADTLIQGWWGYLSCMITPIILIMNAVLLRRLSRLAPSPDRPGQLDPGRPLLHRPQVAGPALAVPALVIVVVVVANLSR